MRHHNLAHCLRRAANVQRGPSDVSITIHEPPASTLSSWFTQNDVRNKYLVRFICDTHNVRTVRF